MARRPRNERNTRKRKEENVNNEQIRTKDTRRSLATAAKREKVLKSAAKRGEARRDAARRGEAWPGGRSAAKQHATERGETRQPKARSQPTGRQTNIPSSVGPPLALVKVQSRTGNGQTPTQSAKFKKTPLPRLECERLSSPNTTQGTLHNQTISVYRISCNTIHDRRQAHQPTGRQT